MSTLGKRPASSASPPPSKHVRTAEYGSSSQDPPLYLPYPPLDAAHAPALPTFQQPVPVQTYSHNATHKQCFDDSAMRYLRPDPPLGADLGHRRAAWVRKQDTRGRLDGLLRALRKAQEEGRVQVEGVVSWRGVMTRLLTAPYEDRDTFIVNVMLVRGVIYLEEHYTDAQLLSKNTLAPRQLEQTYTGYAFESFCTSSTPTSPHVHHPHSASRAPPVWGGDVNTNEQWCVVIKTRLAGMRLLLGGEVDCVRDAFDGRSTAPLVELKTTPAIRHAGDRARFEKKTLRFWTQSFLLGVPTLVVGFKTPQQAVTAVERFDVSALPRLVRGTPGAWAPAVVLGWGVTALASVRAGIERDRAARGAKRKRAADSGGIDADEDPERTVYRATLVPGAGLTLARLDLADMADVERTPAGEEPVRRVGLLPVWYWDAVCGTEHSGETVGAAERPERSAALEAAIPGLDDVVAVAAHEGAQATAHAQRVEKDTLLSAPAAQRDSIINAAAPPAAADAPASEPELVDVAPPESNARPDNVAPPSIAADTPASDPAMVDVASPISRARLDVLMPRKV